VASVSGSLKSSAIEPSSQEEVVLNFGEVPVQSTANRWIELHNFSPVSADVVVDSLLYTVNPVLFNPLR